MNIHFKALLFLAALALTSCWETKPATPLAKPVHLYFGHDFRGLVNVKLNDETMFSGRVNTEASSQFAAYILLHAFSESFDLEVTTFNAQYESITKKERIDLTKGSFIVVISRKDEAIFLFQSSYEPEFY